MSSIADGDGPDEAEVTRRLGGPDRRPEPTEPQDAPSSDVLSTPPPATSVGGRPEAPAAEGPAGVRPVQPQRGVRRRAVRRRERRLLVVLGVVTATATVLAAAAEVGQFVEARAEAAAAGPSLVVSSVLLLDADPPPGPLSSVATTVYAPEQQQVTLRTLLQRPTPWLEIRLDNRGRSPLSVRHVWFAVESGTGSHVPKSDRLGRDARCGPSETTASTPCASATPVELGPGQTWFVLVPLTQENYAWMLGEQVYHVNTPFWIDASVADGLIPQASPVRVG